MLSGLKVCQWKKGFCILYQKRGIMYSN